MHTVFINNNIIMKASRVHADALVEVPKLHNIIISYYASRRSRTRDTVKLTVCVCVCVCVCVFQQ